jgi:DNA-binding transcriptional LysR family regulator
VWGRSRGADRDGEIAVNWALDGHGILMRAEWDIDRYLRSDRLVPVLRQYHKAGSPGGLP